MSTLPPTIAPNTITPLTGSAASAAANTYLIQAALNAGGAINLKGAGVVYISTTLVIGSYTRLVVDPGLTLRATSGTGNVIVSACYLRPWNSASLAWTSGKSATLTLTGHGLSVGDYVWVRGVSQTTDSAYFGVFRVLGVTDANTLTVQLRRVPAAAPAGAIQAKAADKRVSISGGTDDYNYSGGNTGSGSALHSVILAGIGDFYLGQCFSTNAAKYLVCIAAVTDYKIEGLRAFNTASDILKIYGPAFDGEISSVTGVSGDDAVSIQPEEPAAFSQYDFNGGGDIIGVRVRGVSVSTHASGVALYPSPGFLIDEVEADQISNDDVAGVAVLVSSQAAGARIGSLKLRAISAAGPGAAYALYTQTTGGAATIDKLEIDGIRHDRNYSSTVAPINLTGSWTIHRMAVKGWNGLFSRSGYDLQVGSGVSIDLLQVEDSYFEGVGGTFGTVVAPLSGSTIGKLIFKNVRGNGIFRLLDYVGGTVGAVHAQDCSGSFSQLLNINANTSVSLTNN